MSETSDDEDRREERFIRRRKGMRKFVLDPAVIVAVCLIYGSLFLVFYPSLLGDFFNARDLGILIGSASILVLMSKYLGIFSVDRSGNVSSSRQSTTQLSESVDPGLLREIRNYLAHAPRLSSSPPTQINIDEAFQGQLLARLATESQSALASFIESEVFKKTAEAHFRETERNEIVSDIDKMISTYQSEMASWRRNANVNLLIGLVCAVVGIGVMWQTLVTLNFELGAEGSWKIADLYRFLARFGLVLIIESVAFFFLKLYREDRSMIRYLRNEITNLESKCLALKAALSFGSPADITKALQSLSTTERNFLVKKGDRVMSDITYENSEILLEKLLGRYPEVIGKLTKLSVGRTDA